MEPVTAAGDAALSYLTAPSLEGGGIVCLPNSNQLHFQEVDITLPGRGREVIGVVGCAAVNQYGDGSSEYLKHGWP